MEQKEEAINYIMDNCAGQNKNNYVLRLASYLIQTWEDNNGSGKEDDDNNDDVNDANVNGYDTNDKDNHGHNHDDHANANANANTNDNDNENENDNGEVASATDDVEEM